ncbi:MAG TPA: FGGY family carbohydrate kinase [Puia sp.]|nr:FGGY family carbohydrate kinase [Puia sp.]
MKTKVIAIFDVGKTNKKLILFDEQYYPVYEKSIQLPEIVDEDGFPCEDLQALTDWIKNSFHSILSGNQFDLRAINFAAYGASFVHLGANHQPVTPLYNYLKPYPQALQIQFYSYYGGEEALALQTASPVLGSLNSGLQLYRLKYEKPEIFKKISCSLHLPQYLSFLISSKLATDITSLGCHTHLWNFGKNEYHAWVMKEGILSKFADIHDSDKPIGKIVVATSENFDIPVGIGLHDSSAALIPYLSSVKESFILLSTGTWSISLNPFNHSSLTKEELELDCLCYLSYTGKAVKASRLFAGYMHEQQVKKIAGHFSKSDDYYTSVSCNFELLDSLFEKYYGMSEHSSEFSYEHNLYSFSNFEEAYHQLIFDLILQQIESTKLVLKGSTVKKIFVDGGFSKNPVYMQMLSRSFPEMNVLASSMSQATALGAALSIHGYWNSQEVPLNLVNRP